MLVVNHFTQMLKEMLKQLCRGLLHKVQLTLNYGKSCITVK